MCHHHGGAFPGDHRKDLPGRFSAGRSDERRRCYRSGEVGEPRQQISCSRLGLWRQKSILNELYQRGCNLTIYPYGTKAKTILASKPDGVFLTNGPGDPESAEEAITVIEKLITNSNYGPDQMPIFGICMGHQLIALAQGGLTYKLKYGHRGCNHGVFDKKTAAEAISPVRITAMQSKPKASC